MKKEYIIIGLGEVLWDMLPTGKQLGGAPANFAYHAQQLTGGKGYVISAVGRDELGEEITEQIANKGLNSLIAEVEQPTGTVEVNLSGNGIPTYTIHKDVAWDNIPVTDKMLSVAQQADAICFGSLAQRSQVSQKNIYALLKAVSEKALKVFDINLRQHYYSQQVIQESLAYANILKLNEDEITVFADMFALKGSEKEVCFQVIQTFDLKLLVLTKGENGSCLFRDKEVSYLPTPKVEVVDTVGAGDAFTAAVVAGVLKKEPLKEIHQKAVELAAFVCTQKGAMPELG